MRAKSLSDIAIRHEAKERQADARPQDPKNRRRIRWNTLWIFRDREERRCPAIVRRNRMVMSDRLLWIFTIKFIYHLPCNIESFIAIQGGTAFPLIHDDL
jgi:hypothetical protein